MKSPLMIGALASLLSGVLMPARAAAAGRTIEFDTRQVTEPGVALAPDGQWLIFTMVGHLFRLSVTGGTAEQLTSGPHYDTDPVFSPDGRRVAFASDRDGSEGNIFVLEIATKRISQLTRESWAGRPAWTPDGQAIVYLRYVREASPGFSVLSLVRRVALSGGGPETLSAPPRLFRSVFYLPDGRLAWTIIEREPGSPRATTRVEAMTPQGGVVLLRTLEGAADVVMASPAGDGLYCRRHLTPQSGWHPEEEELLFLPLPGGAEKLVTLLPPHESARFAVAADNKSLYLGESGSLWKIALPGGGREAIPFQAHVKLQIEDPVAPPRPVLTEGISSPLLPAVMGPRLSPDGRSLVFVAAGYIWLQTLGSAREPAKRLLEGTGFENWPAFSPDGRQLAFVWSEHGRAEIRMFDFASRQARTVAPGTGPPSWSPDGQRLVFRSAERADSFRVLAAGLSGGTTEQLTETGLWSPRPQFSADGLWLYFSASTSGTGTFYRMALKEKGKPEAITQLSHHLSDGLVSANGRWLAFRRNREIWVAPLGQKPIREKDVRRLSDDGGADFTFTPDSSAVVYAIGNRVWRHALIGDERIEIPIRLALNPPAVPPVLLRNVRLLDFKAGSFGPTTSLLIEKGRIRWIAPRAELGLPPETVQLDAAGRFAIPGLFDMHVHLDRSWHSVGADQRAFLAYGVTSVRETGGEPTWTKSLAERSQATGDPLPRYFFAGELIEGLKSISGDLSLLIGDETGARTYARRLKDQGVHFLKAYPTLPWPLHRALVDEARRLRVPVIGHGMSVEEITRSVILGYATLEHTTFANSYYDDLLQMLAAAGTRWDPTLAIGGGNAFLLRDEPGRWRDAKFRAFATRDDYARGNVCSAHNSLRGSWLQQLDGVSAAHRRGVKLLAGTDSAHPCVYYGSALHWELEHFVHAGLTPLEVLRIATVEAAIALGAQEDLGTLEPGKLADIVLLDKNPLEDIKNTQTIWRVIKGGWLFDPEELRPPASTSAVNQEALRK